MGRRRSSSWCARPGADRRSGRSSRPDRSMSRSVSIHGPSGQNGSCLRTGPLAVGFAGGRARSRRCDRVAEITSAARSAGTSRRSGRSRQRARPRAPPCSRGRRIGIAGPITEVLGLRKISGSWHVVAQLGGVRRVVAADADHLATRDHRRQQPDIGQRVLLTGQLHPDVDRIPTRGTRRSPPPSWPPTTPCTEALHRS